MPKPDYRGETPQEPGRFATSGWLNELISTNLLGGAFGMALARGGEGRARGNVRTIAGSVRGLHWQRRSLGAEQEQSGGRLRQSTPNIMPT